MEAAIKIRVLLYDQTLVQKAAALFTDCSVQLSESSAERQDSLQTAVRIFSRFFCSRLHFKGSLLETASHSGKERCDISRVEADRLAACMRTVPHDHSCGISIAIILLTRI
jgi:hypothetical protein